MKSIKQIVVTFLVVSATMFGFNVIYSNAMATAGADTNNYEMGCETVPWPDLLRWSKKRTVCDGPRESDGGWMRYREIWTPAGYVPWTCNRYSCYGDYSYPASTQSYEEYKVFDYNIPPNEPGWLPGGSVVIR